MNATRLKPRLRVQILFITAARLVMNTTFRFVYPFLPVLGRGLGAGLPAMSQALSLRSFSALASPFLAHFTDTRGRKFGMVLGLTLFSGAFLPLILWPGYPTFVLMLVLTSIGKAVFDPAVLAYLGDRVPYERRGRAIGITEMGWSLSFVLGVPLVGFLIAAGGWTAPFPVLATLGLACLAGVWWLIPRAELRDLPQTPLVYNLRAIFRSSSVVLALLIGALISGANEVVNLVFGVWLESSLSVQIAALGTASLVIGLAELGGESLVSAFTDRLGKARAVAGGTLLNCLTLLALPVLGRSLPGALIGLFFFYLTFEFTLVSLLPLVTEIQTGARATLMATNAAFLLLGRAVTALFASQVYLRAGIGLNAGLAILLNLAALFLLWRFQARQGQSRL